MGMGMGMGVGVGMGVGMEVRECEWHRLRVQICRRRSFAASMANVNTALGNVRRSSQRAAGALCR